MNGEPGSVWTNDEDVALLMAFDCGASITELCRRTQRTMAAITSRLERYNRIIYIPGGYVKTKDQFWVTREQIEQDGKTRKEKK